MVCILFGHEQLIGGVRRIPEHRGLAVMQAGESFREVAREPLEFRGEGLFSDRGAEPVGGSGWEKSLAGDGCEGLRRAISQRGDREAVCHEAPDQMEPRGVPHRWIEEEKMDG